MKKISLLLLAVTAWLLPTAAQQTASHAGIRYFSNELRQFMEPLARSFDFQLPGGKGIYYMPVQTGEFMGYPVYRKYADPGKESPVSILFSACGSLPLRAVSREELIFSLEVFVQSQLQKLAVFQPTANRYLSNGRDGSETLVQKYQDALKRLTLYLESLSAEERARQAIVNDPSEILWTKRLNGIFEVQEKKGGRPLVCLSDQPCAFVQVLID